MKFIKFFLSVVLIALTIVHCEKERNKEKEIVINSPKSPRDESKFKRIAFVGDSGKDSSFRKVLKLIREQKVDLVLHLGDLAYDEDNAHSAKMWDEAVTAELGENFPYIFVIGNHDIKQWFQKDGYKNILQERIKNAGLTCSGDLGIKSFCQFHGITIVQSGVGSYGYDHENYIENTLDHSSNKWRICSWHKNQSDMQTSGRVEDIGWETYKVCQKFGAMIMTGHNHSYSRTHVLSDIGHIKNSHGVITNPNHLEIDKGKTFVVVSGLGGQFAYGYNCIHDEDTWWSTIFTPNHYRENGFIHYKDCENKKPHKTEYGVLFIDFPMEGSTAEAKFITTEHRIIDHFFIHNKIAD